MSLATETIQSVLYQAGSVETHKTASKPHPSLRHNNILQLLNQSNTGSTPAITVRISPFPGGDLSESVGNRRGSRDDLDMVEGGGILKYIGETPPAVESGKVDYCGACGPRATLGSRTFRQRMSLRTGYDCGEALYCHTQ